MLNSVELKEFVESNPKLVQRKGSTNYPGLYVLKYTRKVFYDNLWYKNKMLLECRGLVVDADYNVIVKPFTKVFNHGENGTTIDPYEMCTVVRKVNGFMACATKNTQVSPDKIIVSTTGSLDSDFVAMARTHLDEENMFKDMFEGETLIFEICDESDPHIVPEEYGAYLIGGSLHQRPYTEYALDAIAPGFKMKRPEVLTDMIFEDVVKLSKTVQHEGFMVYGQGGTALKIKSPHYLITKFLARMQDDRLKNMLVKDTIRNCMRNFDEEYYPLIHYIRSQLGDMFVYLGEQDRIQVIRDFLNRKET